MIKKSLYLICTASVLSASATMCYKKEHLDPSTIETIALSGGECKDKLSVNDMKKNGYQVDSMKIQEGKSGFNYIYVFQKETKNIQNVSLSSNTLTDEELTARLENIQKKKEARIEKEEMVASIDSAKNLYEDTCRRCHGDGTISAYNLSRPLKDLSLEDMQIAVRDYSNGSKDNGMAILMQPYANTLTKKDVKAIYNYLKTIK